MTPQALLERVLTVRAAGGDWRGELAAYPELRDQVEALVPAVVALHEAWVPPSAEFLAGLEQRLRTEPVLLAPAGPADRMLARPALKLVAALAALAFALGAIGAAAAAAGPDDLAYPLKLLVQRAFRVAMPDEPAAPDGAVEEPPAASTQAQDSVLEESPPVTQTVPTFHAPAGATAIRTPSQTATSTPSPSATATPTPTSSPTPPEAPTAERARATAAPPPTDVAPEPEPEPTTNPTPDEPPPPPPYP